MLTPSTSSNINDMCTLYHRKAKMVMKERDIYCIAGWIDWFYQTSIILYMNRWRKKLLLINIYTNKNVTGNKVSKRSPWRRDAYIFLYCCWLSQVVWKSKLLCTEIVLFLRYFIYCVHINIRYYMLEDVIHPGAYRSPCYRWRPFYLGHEWCPNIIVNAFMPI